VCVLRSDGVCVCYGVTVCDGVCVLRSDGVCVCYGVTCGVCVCVSRSTREIKPWCSCMYHSRVLT
jgi:hypothetical protein